MPFSRTPRTTARRARTGTLICALLLLVMIGGGSTAQTTSRHTVRAGDTLFRLAQRSGTSVQHLMNINHLTQAALRPGQMLKLPSTQVSTLQAAADAGPKPVLPKPDPARVTRPVVWKTAPAPTVTDFIGWLSLSSLPIGNALPVRTYLDGLAFSMQTQNNCGPSALVSVLGYYKVKISQAAIQRTARPNGGYMQVSAIAPELAKFKLKTITIRNGQLSQVKRLLSMGIPVIVLQWYETPGHIPHFRVVRGYDDQAQIFWISDSMVGPLGYMSYRSFDTLWNTQGRKLFPIYPEGYDRAVKLLATPG